MKIKYFLPFTLALMFSVVGIAFGQKNQPAVTESNDIWINLPSAPLRIAWASPNNKSNYTLGNYSTERIVKYRWGCVEEESGQNKVVSRRAFQSIDIEPLDRATNAGKVKLFGASHVFPEELCSGKARLAIVDVEFADGAMWKAN